LEDFSRRWIGGEFLYYFALHSGGRGDNSCEN